MTSPHCSYQGCTRPIHNADEGKCIFHCEKKDPQEFRNALAQQVRQWRKEKTEDWDFRGWVFWDTERKGDEPWQKHNLFSRAVFPARADFRSATFSGYANFESATFSGYADFESATFLGNADFESATFSEDADFEDTAFWENVNFRKTTFSGYAFFIGAIFLSELEMRYTCFGILGDFTNANIGGNIKLIWPGWGHVKQVKEHQNKRGRLLLENLQFEKKGKAEPLLDLRSNALQEDCKLLIYDMTEAKMKRILLEGTDCRQIEFHNVEWHRVKGRRIVGDEHYLRNDPTAFGDDKPSWNEIAVTYQQLADRFRKDLDHPTANDFERGIFESRRTHAKMSRLWGEYLLYSLYKWISDYSGSLVRPILWLLAVTFAAALCYDLFLFDGTEIITVRAVTESLLTGLLGCGLIALAYEALVSLWFEVPRLWRVALFAFIAFLFGPAAYHGLHHALSFLSVESYETAMKALSLDRRVLVEALKTAQGSARSPLLSIATLQLIFSATLITLFIFSVRRRFKHSE